MFIWRIRITLMGSCLYSLYQRWYHGGIECILAIVHADCLELWECVIRTPWQSTIPLLRKTMLNRLLGFAILVNSYMAKCGNRLQIRAILLPNIQLKQLDFVRVILFPHSYPNSDVSSHSTFTSWDCSREYTAVVFNSVSNYALAICYGRSSMKSQDFEAV